MRALATLSLLLLFISIADAVAPFSKENTTGIVVPNVKNAELPLARIGRKCGSGIANCEHGCCSQLGVCGHSAEACGATCQPKFSSPHSPCANNLGAAAPNPDSLPFVGTGAVCGKNVARCQTGCCNQLNYCEEETNNKTGKPAFACSISSCSLPASPNSDACKQVHGNANTVTRRYKLVATWGKAAPDGKEVDVVLINGLYPAPTIFSNAGDRLIVEFVNQLEGPTTSIHWHGINQIETNIQDGVEGVTQTAIPGFLIGGGDANATLPSDRNATVPSPVFVYNFVTDAAGAFWYHDHSLQLTYVDGFRGILSVADPWSPVPHVSRNYSNVPAVLLADHYHSKAALLAEQFINASNSEGVEPVPLSMTINGYAGVRTPWCGGGKGQPACKSSVINATDINGCDDPNTKLVLVSGSAFAFFFVHLESPGSQLRAKVLEVDGLVLAEPVSIALSEKEPLHMHPAQRYGVEVCAVDPKGARRKPGRLIIRAQVDQFGGETDDTNGLGLNGSPACTPKTLGNCSIVDVASAVFDMGKSSSSVVEGNKLPGWPSLSTPANGTVEGPLCKDKDPKMIGPTEAAPPAATKTVEILLSTGFLTEEGKGPQYFFFNNVTWSVPGTVALLDTPDAAKLPSGASSADGTLTAGSSIIDLKYGDVVDFVVTNTDNGDHPLHLHGQSFWVMAAGDDGEDYEAGKTELEPMIARDVAIVQGNSYIVMRFQASNPGLWFFHCHYEMHLADGLALVVRTTAK